MPRIGIRPLAQLLRRVGMALRAGVAARQVWDKEANRGTLVHRQQLALVSNRIAAGDTCAEALRACPGYFPSLTCDLVEVGEKTGRLDEVLLQLAEHYEHLLALRRTFLIGITWPAIQLGAAIGVIGLLIWVMGLIASGPSGPIDILGFGLVGTSGLVIYLLLVAGVIGICVGLGLALVRGWLGTGPLQLAMRVPVIGGCLRTAALSRFAWTLSMTLDAGLDAHRSLQLAFRAAQNAYYTSGAPAALQAIQQGREFHEALRTTRVFPDDFLDALENAELAGTPGETLNRLAVDYRERAQGAARMLTVAATFAIWVLVAAILILLIFRLAMFYLGTIYDALKGI